MTRFLLALLVLLLIGALGWGVAWMDQAYDLIARPRVTTGFAGYPEFRMSAFAVAWVFGGALVIALLGGRIWQFFASLPGRLRERRQAARQRRGYQALTKGLAAVAAGDAQESANLARTSKALLKDQRLTALLSAQSAQLQGHEDVATQEFRILLKDEETAFLGLRGLAMQALRHGQPAQALRHVKAAQALRPDAPWVLNLLYRLELEGENAPGAIAATRASLRTQLIDKAEAQARLAPLHTHAAREALAANQPHDAAAQAAEALSQEATYLPALLVRAQALIAAGRASEAATLITRTWRKLAHPGLFDLFVQASEADFTTPAGKRVGLKLLKNNDGSRAAQLLLGEFLLQHLDLDPAEAALKAAATRGSARAQALLDTLPKVRTLLTPPGPRDEETGAREGGGNVATQRDRARDLITAALAGPQDAGWVCAACGTEHPDWALICPECGTSGQIEWQDHDQRRLTRVPPPSLEPTLLSGLN